MRMECTLLSLFYAQEHGLAMGIRQTAPPVGGGIAEASSLPGASHVGFEVAVALPAVLRLIVGTRTVPTPTEIREFT
jgi:sugar phosphate permease